MIFIWLLLAANLSILIFGLVKSVNNKKIEISYITLFSIGFFVYWMLPILFMQSNLIMFINFPLKESWINIYNSLSRGRMIEFLTFSLLFYACFFAGSLIKFKMNYSQKKNNNIQKLEIYSINFFLIIVGLMLVFLIFQLRTFLFTGYQQIDWKQTGTKGNLVGASLIFLNLFLIKKLIQEKNGIDLSLKNFFLNKEMLFYLIIEIFILSMGTRIYFLISLIALLAFTSTYITRFRLKIVALSGIFIFFLVGGIGVFRYGFEFEKFNLVSILNGVSQEYMLNSFSLISTIHFSHWGIIKIPIFLLHDLAIGMHLPIPSLNPSDLGYPLYSPVGGTSLFYSLIINFGIIGSLIFAFLLSLLLNYLRCKSTTYTKVVYICFSATLAFAFFRDNFYISLVKIGLQDFVIIPSLVLLFIKITSYLYSKLEAKKLK